MSLAQMFDIGFQEDWRAEAVITAFVFHDFWCQVGIVALLTHLRAHHCYVEAMRHVDGAMRIEQL